MTLYDKAFYDTIRPGIQSSAKALVPVVLGLLNRNPLDGPPELPQTVLDVGCGEGWWAHEFGEAMGGQAIGIDGPHISRAATPLGDRFWPMDLMQPFAGEVGSFDLVVCLEVAEHLPADRAESFVAELCSIAPTVLFSAAIPGQPGAGHINCQWPEYWAALFGQHGYGFDGSVRDLIWGDDRIEPWYRQNLHIAAKGGPVTIEQRVHPIIASWLK